MSKKCELTGKIPMKGHNVSHANNKTKRRFLPNLKKAKFTSELLKRSLTLTVSNAGVRCVDKKGTFDQFLKTVKNKNISPRLKKLKKSILIAFSYPVAFLITDLANRSYGKVVARKIVYVGFIIGIVFTLFFSTNFADLISVRIAIGSGIAFMVAQLLDVQIFDYLRKKKWFVAPLTSSLIGSTVDTFLFFSISFYATGIPWVTLSLGDLAVKIFVALAMLIPFRLLLGTFKASKA
jgi:ribosomal protein L28